MAIGTDMGRRFSNMGGMPVSCWAKPETGTILRKIAAVSRPRHCCIKLPFDFSSWIWHRGGDFPVEFASPVVCDENHNSVTFIQPSFSPS